MKVKEFYVNLFWNDLEKGRELSPNLEDMINDWLENNDITIIDIRYCHSREYSSALVIYKYKSTELGDVIYES